MIQNLIDELRKQLPMAKIIELQVRAAGGHIFINSQNVLKRFSWGDTNGCSCKTPDEALHLLRKRLGLEGEK